MDIQECTEGKSMAKACVCMCVRFSVQYAFSFTPPQDVTECTPGKNIQSCLSCEFFLYLMGTGDYTTSLGER